MAPAGPVNRVVRSLIKILAPLTIAVTLTLVPQAGPGRGAALARTGGGGSAAARASVPPVRIIAPGISHELRVLFALPDQRVRLPIAWASPRPLGVRYAWTRDDGAEADALPGGPPLIGAPLSAVRGQDADWLKTAAALPADGSVAAPSVPGLYRLRLGAPGGSDIGAELRLIVEVPFSRKESGYLDGYYVGRYPTEGQRRSDRYVPPAGFIRVTAGMKDLYVSEHFRLGQFLTHDQRDTWPKFAVLDPRLLDKLELVMAELRRRGVPAQRMYVMSGYRTPQYNRRGLDRGRARLSRHQWGDAADVWIDDDGDGYMDDLNGDGRRDTRDALFMLSAVDAVERAHPELVGGAGIYRDNGVHGPFIHIDARGHRARW